MKTLDDITSGYGPDWATGVLAEHLGDDIDHLIHVAPSGKTYATTSKGGAAVPVVCGEIVEIYTEDGKIDGRCSNHVYNNGFACPGHTEVINEYRTSRYDHLYDTEEF